MKILKYKEFEAISGMEWVGKHTNPHFPENELPNSPNRQSVDVLYCDINDTIYTLSDFQDLFIEYKKSGGTENMMDFNKENLCKVVKHLFSS